MPHDYRLYFIVEGQSKQQELEAARHIHSEEQGKDEHMHAAAILFSPLLHSPGPLSRNDILHSVLGLFTLINIRHPPPDLPTSQPDWTASLRLSSQVTLITTGSQFRKRLKIVEK